MADIHPMDVEIGEVIMVAVVDTVTEETTSIAGGVE